MADASSRRAYAKVGSYEIAHLVRDENLSAPAAWVLLTLTIQADYRTHRWRGTTIELARDTGMTRTTAARSVDRLAAAGLVEVVQPFKQGDAAVLVVAAYDRIVIPNARRTPRSLDASRAVKLTESDKDASPQVSAPRKREFAIMAEPEIARIRATTEQSARNPACFECGGEADGRPTFRGDPACRAHEDF